MDPSSIISLNIFVLKLPTTLTAMVTDLAEGDGDLTKRPQLSSRDEVGQQAGGFNRFIERKHTLVDEIAGRTSPPDDAAGEMAAVGESLSLGLGSMTRRSQQGDASAEQMSVNMQADILPASLGPHTLAGLTGG